MNAAVRNYRPEPDLSPRLAAMAEAMRELRWSPEGATEQALVGRGFSMAEILEYAVEAAALAASTSQADALRFDRVPDILQKAVAAMPHGWPRLASHEPDAEAIARWQAFCVSRAAFKLDPWEMQAERCLARLDAALKRWPLLPTETNRIVLGLRAEQIAFRQRART